MNAIGDRSCLVDSGPLDGCVDQQHDVLLVGLDASFVLRPYFHVLLACYYVGVNRIPSRITAADAAYDDSIPR